MPPLRVRLRVTSEVTVTVTESLGGVILGAVISNWELRSAGGTASESNGRGTFRGD